MFLKDLKNYQITVKKIFKIYDEIFPKHTKYIKTEDAYNKVSAENIYSPIDLPMFNKSAMDGYAVNAQDTYGASENNPIILNIVSGEKIDSDECIKVSTGMPIPNGANAVVMKEYVNEEDGFVEVFKSVHPNENISKIGEDVKEGDLILKKGETIGPYHIALLSSLGIKKVKVYNFKVGILSTGDELINLDDFNSLEELKSKKKIINSNTPMIKSLIKDVGIDENNINTYNSVEDNKESIKKCILKMLEENDVVFTTGGTSVGDRDFTISVIKEIGDLIIHGVKIRPGKPFGFAKIKYNGKDRVILILSGYPVAAAVQFELFFRNYFKKRKSVYLPLNRNVPSSLGRTDFVRVKFIEKGGISYIEPIRITGSGVLSSIKDADGYILIEDNVEGYEGNTFVKVYLY